MKLVTAVFASSESTCPPEHRHVNSRHAARRHLVLCAHCMLDVQWIPAHRVIVGNERADVTIKERTVEDPQQPLLCCQEV